MRGKTELTVDPESWGLAVHFLPFTATDALKQSLAEAIQGAVEDWFVGRCEDGTEHDFVWTYDIEGSGERHDYEACSKCHESR